MSAHLSDEQREVAASGSTEFDSHLSGCEACRREVKSAKGRQAMLRGLAPYTLSDLAFRRVEAKLMEQAEAGLPSVWPAWLKVLLPVGVLAAALLVLVRTPDAPTRPEVPVAVAPKAPRTFPALRVTYASADARLRLGDDEWKTLSAPFLLPAGAALSAGRVVVSTNGPVFSGEGSFAVGADAFVAVGAGSVAMVGEGDVLAGQRRVSGSIDSAFRIERTAAELVLDVASGSVDVRDEGSSRRKMVKGPARVRWADGSTVDDGVESAFVDFAQPRGASAEASAVDLSALPAGASIDLDDLPVGVTPFSFVVEPGRHEMRWALPGQPSQTRSIDVTSGTPFLFAMAPEPKPEPEAVEPDPKALAQVLTDLKRQTPKLRACYEKWLKANPSAAGTVDLVLVVTARGAVKRADVKGDPISPESAACLKSTAKSLVLSPLGSEQELEVPLVLTPGKR